MLQTTEETELTMPSDFRWHSFLVSAGYLPDTFRKTNEEVMVSIVKAEKEEGSHDIEFNLKEPIAGEWEKQVIRYSQLKTEIIEKLGEYVEFITISNTEHPEIEKIDELLKGFQKCDF